MANRHNHWLWNSRLVDFVHQRLLNLTTWIWKKQNHNH